MGRISRHYEKEAGEWIQAIGMMMLFVLLLGVIAAVLAIALIIMMVGGLMWGVGILIEAATKGEHGKGFADAGRSVEAFPGKLWQQARGKKPKAVAKATYVPPPLPPPPPPQKQYEVKCPTCTMPLVSTAGDNVGCPKCGTRMTVTPG